MLIVSTPWEGKKPDFEGIRVKYVEFRLDYYPNPLQINFSSFTKHDILCYKSDQDELLVLEKMLSSKAMVDVDIDLLKRQNLSINSRMIVSTHLSGYDNTKITEFLSLKGNPFAFKLVFPAKSFQEILDTAELIKASGKTNVIFNVTGKWSIFQRQLYKAFASMGAYCFFEKHTEPSQPEYMILLNADSFINEKDNLFCGIIGGNHVPDSLSYLSYNVYFYINKLRASFVPIPCNDIDEVVQVLHWLLPRYHSMSFVITNPFKSAIARAVKSHGSVINTICFNAYRSPNFYYNRDFDSFILTANTDVMGLENILRRFSLPLDSSILIYGTGDCADAFARKLIRLGYNNLYLTGRNPDKADQLYHKYKLKSDIPQEVKLLINASELGKDASDDISFLPKFLYLIELPYQQDSETQLEKLGKEVEAEFISGRDFFMEQVMHQVSIVLPTSESDDDDFDEEVEFIK